MSQLVFGVGMNALRSGCPINLTLEALGDRWSLIVIRDLMFGNRRHFRELLARSEEGIVSNILADWLTRLEKAGLVYRRDDPSHKQKVIYGVMPKYPSLWSEFMEELRHLHLETPAPRGSVFSRLQSAYEAAIAKPLV
jgi:DNA-binding HxlR family transcriptional regulator